MGGEYLVSTIHARVTKTLSSEGFFFFLSRYIMEWLCGWKEGGREEDCKSSAETTTSPAPNCHPLHCLSIERWRKEKGGILGRRRRLFHWRLFCSILMH